MFRQQDGDWESTDSKARNGRLPRESSPVWIVEETMGDLVNNEKQRGSDDTNKASHLSSQEGYFSLATFNKKTFTEQNIFGCNEGGPLVKTYMTLHSPGLTQANCSMPVWIVGKLFAVGQS